MKQPTDSPVNPKLLYALGTLVAAALLFVFVVNPMFLNPDEFDDPGALPVPGAPAETVPSEEGDEAVDEEDGDAVHDSLGAFNARDPFRQLVVPEPGEQ